MADKNDYSIDFTNDYDKCRIIIKDADTDEMVADTTILEYQKDFHSILVKLPIGYKSQSSKFSLLIFTANRVILYLGSKRKDFNMGFTEIALHSGKIKEDRLAQRFPINVDGMITGLLIDEKHHVTLRKPLEMKAVNISANGILINTRSDCFFDDTVVEVKVTMYGSATTLYCKIIRITENDMDSSDYGCRLVNKEPT